MSTKTKLYALAIATATLAATFTSAEARVAPNHSSIHVAHVVKQARSAVHLSHPVNVTRRPIQSAPLVKVAQHSAAGLPVTHKPPGSGKGTVKPAFDVGGAINDVVNTIAETVGEVINRVDTTPGPTCGWLVCSDGS